MIIIQVNVRAVCQKKLRDSQLPFICGNTERRDGDRGVNTVWAVLNHLLLTGNWISWSSSSGLAVVSVFPEEARFNDRACGI